MKINKLFNRILAVIVMLMACLTISAQHFEGVWSPSSEGFTGNIKIQNKDGQYYVQIKTKNGLKAGYGNVYNGVLYLDCSIGTNYGKWWIGRWNGENNHILVGHGDGYSYGTNGVASNIYDSSYNSRYNCATKEIEYIGFKLVLEEENLHVYWCMGQNYLANDRVVFSQSSNWISRGIYTNW